MCDKLDSYYRVALELANEGGKVVREAFSAKKSYDFKASPVDLVTVYDQRVEKLICDGITQQFPDHKFIGEESDEKQTLTDDPTWIIDPIDGTMNFVHGFPVVAICIGLAVKKQVEIGIVYNPIHEELYTARRGHGAFLNNFPIHVSGVKKLGEALVIAETGSARDAEKMNCVYTNIQAVLPKCHSIRMMGSAALNMCYIARGAADAYYEYGLHCWDMAASDIILREAGGASMDPTGAPLDLMNRRILCGSSQELIEEIKPLLHHIQLERD